MKKNKYVRTKDRIYKYADYLGIHNGKRYALMDNAQGKRITLCQKPEELYKEADTIEGLIMPNDLLFFTDDNGNKIPVYVDNLNWLNSWIRTHDIYKISELYIKVGNDYKCIAKMNNKGALELL